MDSMFIHATHIIIFKISLSACDGLVLTALSCIPMFCIPYCVDEIHKVVAQGNKLLKMKVPALRGSLRIYLANEETEHILFRPIKVCMYILLSFCKGSVCT